MTRKKYEFVEEVIDDNGVKRIYGYGMHGDAHLINAREVSDEYKAKGLKGFSQVV